MKIDDIFDEWKQDCEIDLTNISGEAAKIGRLHHKYFQMYSQETLKLQALRAKMKKLRKLKTEYFNGSIDEDDLRRMGWEPNRLKILKADIPTYLEADEDIIDLTLKIGLVENKISVLESFIKRINNRSFELKTITDWTRLQMGG